MRKNRPSRKARKRRRVIARYCAAIVGMFRKRLAMAPAQRRAAAKLERARRDFKIKQGRAQRAAARRRAKA